MACSRAPPAYSLKHRFLFKRAPCRLAAHGVCHVEGSREASNRRETWTLDVIILIARMTMYDILFRNQLRES